MLDWAIGITIQSHLQVRQRVKAAPGEQFAIQGLDEGFGLVVALRVVGDTGQMRSTVHDQQVAEFGQDRFPDRDELPAVITDQLLRPPTALDGLLRDAHHPLGAGGQAGDGRQRIARVV